MRLLDPSALALAGLAPALVLLYFLKLRRRRMAVPSLLLWRALASDPRANSLFERLRRRSLLLLQILILLGLVVAAGRPYLPLRGLPGKTLVVVLDGSGSMKAREEDGRTRFEQARARAAELVDHLGGGEEMLLLRAGTGAEVIAPFTGDGKALRLALASVQPADAPADLGAAIATAQALGRARRGTGIVVLSDLAGDRLIEPRSAPGLVYEVVGARGDNVAITLLAVRERAASSFDREGLVGIRNFGDLPARVALTLELDGRQLLAESLEIEARGSGGKSFALPAGSEGVLLARIAPGGALDSDDVARAVLVPRSERKVAIEGQADPWLLRALGVDRRLRIVVGEPADVTVWVHRLPPAPLPGPALLIDPPPASGGLVLAGVRSESPVITDFRRDHPVLAWVDLTGVGLAACRPLAAAPGTLVLAETTAGPLLVAGEAAAGRWLALGLDPLESDWPLRVGWPIFVQNALGWLRADDETGRPVLAGESAIVRLPEEARSWHLVSPAGEKRALAAAGARAVLPALDQAGLWRIEGAGREIRIAVNSGSETASRILPGPAPPPARTAEGEETGGRGAALTGHDVTPWVLLLGLALLLLEWHAWHRRLLG